MIGCVILLAIMLHQFNNYNTMHYPQISLVPSRRITRHISQNVYLKSRQIDRIDRGHRLSEPRGKITLIKINRSKLPGDFFPKKENRRCSQRKIYFPEQFTQPLLPVKQIESERFIYSPEKTSFFGTLEQQKSENLLRGQQGCLLSRKFETREQSKRQLWAETTRKQSNTSKPSKRSIIQLFPSQFDQQISQIMTETTKAHLTRTTPKELAPLQRENLLVDPQKKTQERKQRRKEKLTNASTSIQNQSGEMNITFYNAKSSSLPPINRPL